MTEKKHLVESFNIDHTKMIAPFVRVAGEKEITGGGKLIKYDIRFTQPNVEHLEWPVQHSIEHMLATTLREITDGVSDISCMGCATGYYAVTDSGIIKSREDFIDILLEAIMRAQRFTETPAATIIECGWAAAHDAEGAKKAMLDFASVGKEKLLIVTKENKEEAN